MTIRPPVPPVGANHTEWYAVRDAELRADERMRVLEEARLELRAQVAELMATLSKADERARADERAKVLEAIECSLVCRAIASDADVLDGLAIKVAELRRATP